MRKAPLGKLNYMGETGEHMRQLTITRFESPVTDDAERLAGEARS